MKTKLSYAFFFKFKKIWNLNWKNWNFKFSIFQFKLFLIQFSDEFLLKFCRKILSKCVGDYFSVRFSLPNRFRWSDWDTLHRPARLLLRRTGLCPGHGGWCRRRNTLGISHVMALVLVVKNKQPLRIRIRPEGGGEWKKQWTINNEQRIMNNEQRTMNNVVRRKTECTTYVVKMFQSGQVEWLDMSMFWEDVYTSSQRILWCRIEKLLCIFLLFGIRFFFASRFCTVEDVGRAPRKSSPALRHFKSVQAAKCSRLLQTSGHVWGHGMTRMPKSWT